MPRKETILQVFVGSPSDVQDERTAVREVIDDLNNTWAANSGVRFEAVSWETHAVPGMGESAQSVINQILPNDFDIFVGILWTRFGTPTKEAESGTEEEFHRAFERYKAVPNSVEILFYFKDEQVSPSSLDIGQLAKVVEFRNKIQELGLYWTFTTTEQFKANLRTHLGRILQKWTSKTLSSTAEDYESNQVETDTSEETLAETPEFLDLAADAEEAMDKVTSVAENLQIIISELGMKMRVRSEEIENMVGTEAHTAKNARKAINIAATDLERFSRSTNQELPILRENLGASLRIMADAAFKGAETGLSDSNTTSQLRDNIVEFESTIQDTLSSMLGFKESIVNLPSLTSSFNRARRAAMGTMDQFVSELELGRRTALEVMDLLQKKIDDAC